MTILFSILGVLLIIGGVGCIFTPLATMLSAGYIIGILLLVYGIFGIVRCITQKGDALEWILNILAVIIGIFAIVRPGGTLAIDAMLIILLAVFFLVEGVIHIVMAFKTRGFNRSWGLELVVGILALFLGILAFLNPTFAAVSVGILIGLFFIECGISMITFAVAANEE